MLEDFFCVLCPLSLYYHSGRSTTATSHQYKPTQYKPTQLQVRAFLFLLRTIQIGRAVGSIERQLLFSNLNPIVNHINMKV